MYSEEGNGCFSPATIATIASMDIYRSKFIFRWEEGLRAFSYYLCSTLFFDLTMVGRFIEFGVYTYIKLKSIS